MNIGHIPAKHARSLPDQPALIDATTDRRVTWRQLEARVTRVASALEHACALARGARVAVLSKNCIEYMELYFATARIGLILQPLNWRLGAEELARILEDGGPDVVVFSAEFAGVARELQQAYGAARYLQLGADGDYEALLQAAPDKPSEREAGVGDDDPMLILYTGGTTGRSKGELHTHRSVFAGMSNQTVAERIQRDDVYMLTGQMFHIPVVLAMNYMAHGCPVVLMNFEARHALEVIQRERVSAFLGVTTMLNWMMAVEDFAAFDLSSLRNIQYGGGPMPRSVVEAALKAFPCSIIQGYGQTEGMTMSFLSQEDHRHALDGTAPQRLSSCGREAFLTTLRIVDAEGRDVPRDGETAGEIIVRSEANMVGYWRQPEQTAAALRDGWLYTGDIATWDSDGYVFIVDRAKDMIISGGENIFSTQVEAAIHQHPAVLEAAVFGIPDPEWGEAVKAVVVLKPGQSASERDIIDVASRHLASYQKPRSVDFVDSLPKAPTGKILKRDLRDPYWKEHGKNV